MTQKSLMLMTNSVAMGGMEEHVRLLAGHLDRDRYRVHAVVPDWEPLGGFETSLRRAADDLSLLAPDRRHGVVRQYRDAWRLWRLARRERFDAAHLHSTSYRGLTVAVLTLRLAGVRGIVMTEHLAPDGPIGWRSRRTRWLLTAALAALVCVSDNNRNSREKFFGAAPCQTFVVDNGVDFERFALPASDSQLAALRADLGISPTACIVGTAIRLERDKGVDDLVDAFALVHRARPDTVLLVAGDGSERASLEERARSAGIADAVHFVGFLNDPRDHIRLMDVFVLPVPFGSASIGLLEAMAMRRACVITFGGDKEAVQHGVTGLCAKPLDPASLAGEIGRLVDDPLMRDSLAGRAQEVVRTDYSAARVARQLADVYDGVAR